MSRAGRLVLIKSILEDTPVFWMALAWIPRSILARIQQIYNRYLWNGNQDKNIFAWVGWNKIVLPKKWGGWGLKDFPLFAQALVAKMCWTLLIGQNLWTAITYHKYIWPQQIMDLVRLPSWPKTGISSVWKEFLHSLLHIKDNLTWRINDGTMARIGLDPWAGGGGRYQLSREPIQHLHSHELKVIANIADHHNSTIFSQG